MNGHEATHRALAGNRKPVALRAGVSASTVDDWCAQPVCDGGGASTHAPVRRVLETVLALRMLGSPNSELLIQWLCGELGYLPPVRIDAVADPTDVGLLASVTREHSEILATWADALHNGSGLTLSEAERFRAEIRDLLIVLGRWDQGLQQHIHAEEELMVMSRRGPKAKRPRLYELRRATA